MSLTPLKVLHKYWGYSAFRPLQEEIVNSIIARQDTLALLPTGGGKSVCFQVPGLIMHGTTIVISPLIALMKDQVEQLKRRGITASAIHSGMSVKEIDITLDNAVYGGLKFLYVSPERIKSDLFLERVKKMEVGLLAIDEAHCISQWGYDFRPPYLEISNFRQIIPEVPCIALTASATPEVRDDIQNKLAFSNGKVFQKSFARDNLSYSVFYHEDKEKKVLEILKAVSGSAVVYVRNRRKTKELALFLKQNHIAAEYYHAGLSNQERSIKQENWINNKVRVMVATNAFGMGIDKPDVRVVINIDLPENLESYYQEAGRGGRDEKKAYAVLLYNNLDIKQLEEKIEEAYPSVDFIKKIYQCLANFLKVASGSSLLVSYDFNFEQFIDIFNLPKRLSYNALKRLESQGFLEFNESFYSPSKIFISVSKHDLYKFQVENPAYDIFIKILLRIYGGGLFSDYLPINKKTIARVMNVPEQEVHNKLVYLNNVKLIDYIEQKTTPQVTFLTPRLDAVNLPLDAKALSDRKKIELSKAKAVIAYAINCERCRSLTILEYFGDTVKTPCGKCDVCLKTKKDKKVNQLNYKEIIIDLLRKRSFSVEMLAQMVDAENTENVQIVIREMLDIGQLYFLDNGELCIKN